MERQRFIDVYGDNLFFDEWAGLYSDQELFWQAQYARFYAKEMLDMAMALDKDGVKSNVWKLADNAEAIARVLEESLRIKP